MMIVCLTRVDDQREWYELRETEDDLMALASSVEENHPGQFVVTAIELQENAP